MLLIDTMFLYGMPYLSGIVEINSTIQTILVLILFPLFLLFPMWITNIIGKGGVGLFALNNVIVMIISFILMVAVGSEASELAHQKNSIGKAVVLKAGSSVVLEDFENTPFVKLESIEFAHKVGEPYIKYTSYASKNNGSTRERVPVVKHCAKLNSHPNIELCQECYMSNDYIASKICKDKLLFLDKIHNLKTLNGMVQGNISKDSKIIEIEPVIEDFETYREKKSGRYNTFAPFGYLSIPLAVVGVMLFG